MKFAAENSDRFGLVRPFADAHTLGISAVEQALAACGCRVKIADAPTCQAVGAPEQPGSMPTVARWVNQNGITVLGFSYRLDPEDAVRIFSLFLRQLAAAGLTAERGGRIRAVFFAGLPAACERVRRNGLPVAGVFCGDETVGETLRILGIDPARWPAEVMGGTGYDESRLAFGRDLVAKGDYLRERPLARGGYAEFGTENDSLAARLQHRSLCAQLPLMRAHVGPYLADRREAVSLFQNWCVELAASGFLDVLSIGTSQLTQSAFGDDWNGQSNGGGVPINSPEEFATIWRAARPMLVRTYAGTRNIPDLARMYDQTIHNAWHALSLWWFCQTDGRGPYSVRENLQQHCDTLRYIAEAGKPFEPNVSHHFAFRGADDVTYVVSAVLAARLAKKLGVRDLVLQVMLNTPKTTWGIQDLAKARALLTLVRELQDERFRVILQPRGGLDYFSGDLDKAKAQLAAVTALMDDIEPHDPNSPGIIHVVSYSEASHLADPSVVQESIQITRHALTEYRRLRAAGQVDDMAFHEETDDRTDELLAEARTVLGFIDTFVPDAYTPEGLYKVFASGFLPVPYLWECREEFPHAVQWRTRTVMGAVKVIGPNGLPLPAIDRMQKVQAALRDHAEFL